MYDNDPTKDADYDERRDAYYDVPMLDIVACHSPLRLNGTPLTEDFASNYLDNIIRLYEDCPMIC